MSEVTVVSTQEVPDTPAPLTTTPTVTHYQQIAANLSKALGELLVLIPNFVQSHPTTKGFVRTHQNVPIEFVATAIAAVDSNPELQGMPGFDVTQARDVLQFVEAFRPLMDKLTAAAKNLKFTIDARRAEINTGALQIYGIAKQVARDPQSTTVSSHVDNLKRDLGRTGVGRKRKVKVTAAPTTAAPTPTTPVSTTPTPSTGGFSV